MKLIIHYMITMNPCDEFGGRKSFHFIPYIGSMILTINIKSIVDHYSMCLGG